MLLRFLNLRIIFDGLSVVVRRRKNACTFLRFPGVGHSRQDLVLSRSILIPLTPIMNSRNFTTFL